jgi:RNA-binding protein
MSKPLNTQQKQYLKGLAHNLSPVVMIGQAGLTHAVLSEIDVALLAHELIKIRVLGDDREARTTMYEQICKDLDAYPVQHIGKLLLVYRAAATPKIELPSAKKK